MTVAFQRLFGTLERWNNNQVTPSLSKPHELSFRSNVRSKINETFVIKIFLVAPSVNEVVRWKVIYLPDFQ